MCYTLTTKVKKGNKAMLKFYYIRYITYYKGKEVGRTTGRTLCEESEAKNFRMKVTWENLTDIWEALGGSGCNFSMWNMKKGRQISFDNTWPWQEPKEWKHADPQIEIECQWTERQVSLQDIMEWYDSEKAMKYLRERNYARED